MKAKEMLIAAKDLLDDSDNWQQEGFYATDLNWNFVNYRSEAACRYCILGAIGKVSGINPICLPPEILIALGRVIRPMGITEFNDNKETTHDNVLSVLDKAIGQFP